MVLPKIEFKLKGLFGALALLYPLAVFVSVVIFKVPPNHLSFFIIIFAVLYFMMIMSHSGKKQPVMFISPALLFLIGLTGFSLDTPLIQAVLPDAANKSNYVIKFYPVLSNTAYFIIFWTSIIFPPTLIFDLMLLLDKRAGDSAIRQPVEVFCKKASKAWCVFFALDAILAAFTVFIYPSNPEKADTVWAIYNGAITYAIMLTISLVQFVQGKRLIRKALKETA
jgi:uncharacterized membrane protein